MEIGLNSNGSAFGPRLCTAVSAHEPKWPGQPMMHGAVCASWRRAGRRDGAGLVAQEAAWHGTRAGQGDGGTVSPRRHDVSKVTRRCLSGGWLRRWRRADPAARWWQWDGEARKNRRGKRLVEALTDRREQWWWRIKIHRAAAVSGGVGGQIIIGGRRGRQWCASSEEITPNKGECGMVFLNRVGRAMGKCRGEELLGELPRVGSLTMAIVSAAWAASVVGSAAVAPAACASVPARRRQNEKERGGWRWATDMWTLPVKFKWIQNTKFAQTWCAPKLTFLCLKIEFQ
jgi:hypothetical protein